MDHCVPASAASMSTTAGSSSHSASISSAASSACARSRATTARDGFALPARALDRDRVLRRRLDALQMREHRDPRLAVPATRRRRRPPSRRACFARCGIEVLDARVRMRGAHRKRRAQGAASAGRSTICAAPLEQPSQRSAAARSGRCSVFGRSSAVDTGRDFVGDVHVGSSLARAVRHGLHRIDDGLIAGAAAVIAGKVLADLSRLGFRRRLSKSCAAISMPGVQKPHCSAFRL